MGALWNRRLRNRAGAIQYIRYLISRPLSMHLTMPKAAFVSSLLWLLLWALLWPAVA